MPDLATTVREASRRPECLTAVQGIYALLDQEIAARKPVCGMSGRCCRFEEYGHRLYVTTLELAAFLRHSPQAPAASPAWDGTGCPWQAGKGCTARPLRPFGCRIYFCDPGAKLWQEELYERLHRQLKGLHETLGVAYFYTEWRLALCAVPEMLGR